MPRFAANLSMMFNEVDFLDRFAAARQAGFTGVEYISPYEYESAALAELLKSNGLSQVLFNLPPGNWEAGERGIACLPDRTDEFKVGIETAAGYAVALGCRQVNCLAGIAPEGAEPERLRHTFIENLRYAAERLEAAGVLLLIEAINNLDIPGFFLNTSSEARSIIEEVGSANLAFQYDVYHMQIMEGDLARTIEGNLDLVRHIQIADNPGRHEPGTGEINYPFLFDHLDALGYDGWVSAEYVPSVATTDSLSWMSE